MSDETHKPQQDENPKKDEPEVFAISKDFGGEWNLNRRDFVKAAGILTSVDRHG